MPVTISGSTGVSGVDGSASSPAIEGVDTDTGIFFPAAGVIGFSNDGTERMRIAANGNFGISTSSPATRLDVRGGDGTGGLTSPTGTWAAQVLMNQDANNYNGFAVSNRWASSTTTILEAAMGWNGSAAGYYPVFTIDGIGQAIFKPQRTETMRIDSNNRVGIGNTAPVNKLHVTGDASISTSLYLGATTTVGSTAQLSMQGYNAGGGTGYHQLFAFYNTYGTATNPYKYVRINSTGGIEFVNSAYNAVIFTMANSGDFTASGNITAYSDIRLKTNIHPIQDALAKVQQMQGVSYERKSDGEKKIGFIAQDLQKVLPEVVIENHDGLLSVDYGNIVALLTEAIKEQQQQIEDMKLEIKELKNGNFRTT